jgi:hypothetical protein
LEFSSPMELGDVTEDELSFAVSTALHIQDWTFDTLSNG